MAQIISANVLINFSDVNGLYDSSTKTKIVKEVKNIDKNAAAFILQGAIDYLKN